MLTIQKMEVTQKANKNKNKIKNKNKCNANDESTSRCTATNASFHSKPLTMEQNISLLNESDMLGETSEPNSEISVAKEWTANSPRINFVESTPLSAYTSHIKIVTPATTPKGSAVKVSSPCISLLKADEMVQEIVDSENGNNDTWKNVVPPGAPITPGLYNILNN